MAKDIAHDYKFSQTTVPAHKTSTFTPTAVDTAGFESTMFIFSIGAIGSGATLNVHLHQGASSSPATDVVAADVEIYNWTTAAAVAAASFDVNDLSDNTIVSVQYKGDPSLYRYVTPVCTIGTEHYDMTITCIQGYARRPVR